MTAVARFNREYKEIKSLSRSTANVGFHMICIAIHAKPVQYDHCLFPIQLDIKVYGIAHVTASNQEIANVKKKVREI